MIVTLKSRASGEVMMFGEIAAHMLAIAGKEFADKGIITVEDLPSAISRLKIAIATDTAERFDSPSAGQPAHDDDAEPVVSVAQRALPLVDLFERSLKREVPVVWGV